MTDQLGSVSINSTLVDPFQSVILLRGFEASPVLGRPQGIAVCQNGVRINEAFGDTVNWDLIPDVAIDRVDVVSANPDYGLNALGGAVLVTMKNEGDLTGGSFNQRNASIEYGEQAGPYAAYLGGNYYASDGWRQFSPDTLLQLDAAAGAHGEKLTLNVSFAGANNRLFGEGTTPEQELAAGRSLVFTNPQYKFNELEFVALNAAYRATDALSFQGNAYRREFHQTVLNGNTTKYTSCGNGFLFSRTGPLVSATGGAITDISNGGTIPIGEDDPRPFVRWGSAARCRQPTPERFSATTTISSWAAATTMTRSISNRPITLTVVPSGYFVDTPENTGFIATPVSLCAADAYYGIFRHRHFQPHLRAHRHRQRPLHPRRDRAEQSSGHVSHRHQPLLPIQSRLWLHLQDSRQSHRLRRLFGGRRHRAKSNAPTRRSPACCPPRCRRTCRA